jgi:hypothetical protein
MRRSVGEIDELKIAVMAKLDEVDVDGVDARLDRLEAAIMNIERATVHLDEQFTSSLEALPDFVAKRIRPS